MNTGWRKITLASWVTHMMIADRIMELFPSLSRHEFMVGNIAPDCNLQNEDGNNYTPTREVTPFVKRKLFHRTRNNYTPTREVTHWMSGKWKTARDSERFLHEYVEKKERTDHREESFLMGYYAHLIADAEFQRFIRDEKRVGDVWNRISQHPRLKSVSAGLEESWDSVKVLIGLEDRMRDLYAIEAKYLDAHPDSGYLTDIMNLSEFPDYIDYLPKGAIVRKIQFLRYLPREEERSYPNIALTEKEHAGFVDSATKLVTEALGRWPASSKKE